MKQETYLSEIFADTRFREFGRYRLFGEIDGRKVGVVLATRSPRFDNYALNKADFERLIAGRRDGKIDCAFVVFAKVNGNAARVYCEHIDAAEMSEKLKGVSLRNGEFGAFYVLPVNFTSAGFTNSDDEPF